MCLAASMNMLRVGYQCSGGATSVDLPVKFMVALLSLVCYFISDGVWVCGAIGSTLIIGGV